MPLEWQGSQTYDLDEAASEPEETWDSTGRLVFV